MTPFTINESQLPPNPPVRDDALTPYQRRSLKFYLRYREQRMTFFGLLWANRRWFLFLFTAFGALAAFVYFDYGTFGAAFVAVAFTFTVLTDIGSYRDSVRIWPVMQKVIDWKKVEELSSSNDNPKA